MILDEFVEMKWNISNKKYYIDKGYYYTKMRDKFNVKVIDLPKFSKTKINVACDVCGKITIRSYCNYISNLNNMNFFSCSKLCSIDKTKKTNLEKYGVEYGLQNNNIKEKSKNTILKKYGVNNVFQNDEIKEKIIKTNLNKYGVKCGLQNDIIKEKSKNTILKKYGVENALQNNLIKENLKKTNLKRYGVENVFQNENVKEKIRKTNLEKYGTVNVSNNENIKEKKRNSCIKKYGEIYFSYSPRFNPNSIYYLDLLSKTLGLPIQHALNGGEKKFVKYWIDGYIEKYNICIEWDEKYHNEKKQKEKDFKKEQFLIENFNCNIIRINEKEFLKDVNSQLEMIKNNIINNNLG